MASKVDKGTPAAPKGAAGIDDLAVLQPDHDIEIAGRNITVREFRFFEGMRLRTQARPLFEDLYALFSAAGTAPGYLDVVELLGQHQDLLVAMVSMSTGCEPEWIAGLSDEDGDKLLTVWWLVNSGFFIRGLMRRAAQERLAASRSDGPASTTNSSPQDTSEAPTTSGA